MLAVDATFLVMNDLADANLLAAADLTSSKASWNGDDAVGLACRDELIDCVGEEGDDPGIGWDVCGESDATRDHTLVRRAIVQEGNTNWTSSSGSNDKNCEWLVRSCHRMQVVVDSFQLFFVCVHTGVRL